MYGWTFPAAQTIFGAPNNLCYIFQVSILFSSRQLFFRNRPLLFISVPKTVHMGYIVWGKHENGMKFVDGNAALFRWYGESHFICPKSHDKKRFNEGTTIGETFSYFLAKEFNSYLRVFWKLFRWITTRCGRPHSAGRTSKANFQRYTLLCTA